MPKTSASWRTSASQATLIVASPNRSHGEHNELSENLELVLRCAPETGSLCCDKKSPHVLVEVREVILRLIFEPGPY